MKYLSFFFIRIAFIEQMSILSFFSILRNKTSSHRTKWSKVVSAVVTWAILLAVLMCAAGSMRVLFERFGC